MTTTTNIPRHRGSVVDTDTRDDRGTVPVVYTGTVRGRYAWTTYVSFTRRGAIGAQFRRRRQTRRAPWP